MDKIEALDRTVLEIDALTAIFCQDEDFNTYEEGRSGTDNGGAKDFFVTTPDALELAQSYIDDQTSLLDDAKIIPRIDVESFVRTNTCEDFSNGGPAGNNEGLRLRISLPPGYPTLASAEVTILSTPKNFQRSQRDDLSAKLQSRVNELTGSEAMMELIHKCRYALDSIRDNNILDTALR